MAGTTNGGINQKPQQPSNNNYGFVSPTGAASQAMQGWENKVTGETFQAGSGGYTNPDPNWTRVNRLASSLRASNGPSNRILGADPVRELSFEESQAQKLKMAMEERYDVGMQGVKAQALMPLQQGGMIMDLNPESPTNGQLVPRQTQPMQQPQGFNINQAAAQGLQGAMATTVAETGYKPMQVNPAMVGQKGYNPSLMAGVNAITANNVTGQGYNAANVAGVNPISSYDVSGQGYGPSTIAGAGQIEASNVTGQGFNASTVGNLGLVSSDNVTAGQLAGSDLSAYTNPYETQVVDQALGDIERNRLMAQNVGSAQAGAANAFGGSRQGIAEAETNRAYMEQAAKTASGLRQAGYMNAQDQAGQDISRRMQASLANQQANMQAGQFNVGTDLASQQANQAANMQANQFGASARNQASLANQQAGMQAQQANAGNALAMQQANQAARMQSGQFGASAANQAALANRQSSVQAQQATAANALQSQQANQQAQNQAGQFGASAFNQAGLANQAAGLQAQQYNAGNAMSTQQANMQARNQAGQFGANASNQAGQLNQAAMMQARLANQNAGLQGSQNRLGAASQLGNLSNLGFGMGQQIQGRMDQQGAMQQALQQQIINAAKGQYAGYTGAPAQSLQYLLQAVGGAPSSGTTQGGYSPGLFDYLSLGAGNAAGLAKAFGG